MRPAFCRSLSGLKSESACLPGCAANLVPAARLACRTFGRTIPGRRGEPRREFREWPLESLAYSSAIFVSSSPHRWFILGWPATAPILLAKFVFLQVVRGLLASDIPK